VKFPLEFDALDLATDELKAKLLPASRKLKEMEKERTERRKVRKRTKTVPTAAIVAAGNAATGGTPATGDVEMADAAPASTEVKGGDLEAESVYREKEAKELAELVDPSVKSDVGCSATGLYDLVGTSFHFIYQFSLCSFHLRSVYTFQIFFQLATSVSISTTLSVHLSAKA
jgi:ubiquitin carboxyl-terminal hydrolase 14